MPSITSPVDEPSSAAGASSWENSSPASVPTPSPLPDSKRTSSADSIARIPPSKSPSAKKALPEDRIASSAPSLSATPGPVSIWVTRSSTSTKITIPSSRDASPTPHLFPSSAAYDEGSVPPVEEMTTTAIWCPNRATMRSTVASSRASSPTTPTISVTHSSQVCPDTRDRLRVVLPPPGQTGSPSPASRSWQRTHVPAPGSHRSCQCR